MLSELHCDHAFFFAKGRLSNRCMVSTWRGQRRRRGRREEGGGRGLKKNVSSDGVWKVTLTQQLYNKG